MVIDDKILKNKLNFLKFGISKNATDDAKFKSIKFSTIDNVVYAYSFDGINNVKVELGPTTKKFEAIIDYTDFTNFIKYCEGDITLEASGKSLSIKTDLVKTKLPVYNSVASASVIPDPEIKVNYDRSLDSTIRMDLIKLMIDPNHNVEEYTKVHFSDVMMVTDTDHVLILKDKVFDVKDVLINVSSLNFLSSLTNVKYAMKKINANSGYIYIKSDEVTASIIVDLNANGIYQFKDYLDLFGDWTSPSIDIDTAVLSKAVEASKMFKSIPVLDFSDKGIFLNVPHVEFSYKITDVPCDTRSINLKPEIAKKICSIGDTVELFYNLEGEPSMIRATCGDIDEILSVG